MKLVYGITVVVVMCAVYVLQYADLSNKHIASTQENDLPSNQNIDIQPKPQNNYSVLAANTIVPSDEESNLDNYKLELTGVIEISRGKGYALIKLNAGEIYKYKVGDIITGAATLKEVHNDKALIQDKDHVFEITIDRRVTANDELDALNKLPGVTGIIAEGLTPELESYQEKGAVVDANQQANVDPSSPLSEGLVKTEFHQEEDVVVVVDVNQPAEYDYSSDELVRIEYHQKDKVVLDVNQPAEYDQSGETSY